MSLYVLLFAASFVAIGCSSSSDDILNDDTPTDDTETTTGASALDADGIISAALSVINTEQLQRAMDLAPIPTTDDAFTLVDPNFTDGMRTWNCPISGTVDIASGGEGSRQYHDCLTEAGEFDGGYRLASNSAGNLSVLVNFDQFSVAQGNTLLSIERGDLFYSESADPVGSRQWIWTDVAFSNMTMSETLDAEIETVRLEKTGLDDFRAEFDATFQVNETSAMVTSVNPLASQAGDRYYTTGQFEINSDDDFSIAVDADGGNPDSAIVTVTTGASIESQLRDWSDSFFVDCLSDGSAQRPAIDCGSE